MTIEELASEIIKWQADTIKPGSYKSVYNFDIAKELAEHILNKMDKPKTCGFCTEPCEKDWCPTKE
jgi:hypothetical protein